MKRTRRTNKTRPPINKPLFGAKAVEEMDAKQSKGQHVRIESPTPPGDGPTLAAWLLDGVKREIEALEKEGGARRYELLSGREVERAGQDSIVEFTMADSLNVPEDSKGTLTIGEQKIQASVIWQQGQRLRLRLPGGWSAGIQRAFLSIDNTHLLHSLAQAIEEGQKRGSTAELATTMFHPSRAVVGSDPLPAIKVFRQIEGDSRSAIEQALGSNLTYLWGPPGTGKTYTIAYLVRALLEKEERTLIVSHTNAAVDQILYECLKSENSKPGPLTDHPAIGAGQVIRLGKTISEKIPKEVILEHVVEERAKEVQNRIQELEDEIRKYGASRSSLQADLTEYDHYQELEKRIEKLDTELGISKKRIDSSTVALGARIQLVAMSQDRLERATKAWFFRESREKQAQTALNNARFQETKVRNMLDSVTREHRGFEESKSELATAMLEHMHRLDSLRPEGALRAELESILRKVGPIEHELADKQNELSHIASEVLTKAQVVFCTLTKAYAGADFPATDTFDAVIADEISMAMPPALFLSACRARARLVLAGDFLQLPPIVQSDDKVSQERLGTDLFTLAGVARGLKPAAECDVLVKLRWQRRMAEPIAEIARRLCYRAAGGLEDHESIHTRPRPEWTYVTGDKSLVIVDTSDLDCWAGRQAGKGSMFNFYSAALAVDVAALLAGRVNKPDTSVAQPIGIVTPYASQKRLLARIIAEMELGEWVLAGTVHTFQGNQCNVIIFDSVLDEPYWTSRLTNPNQEEAVRRDLNVAITRAMHTFVFVGSSEWLNSHAKITSGMGKFWKLLTADARLVQASELVSPDFYRRIAETAAGSNRWLVPTTNGMPDIEILDEHTFFDAFGRDMTAAKKEIFGLVPFFGEYRWPKVEPLFRAALARGVQITLVIPELKEAQNKRFVGEAIDGLRKAGAIIIESSGLHGKDIIIDRETCYFGSLNWASHRSRSEVVRRCSNRMLAENTLDYMQARFIRQAAIFEDGTPRTCVEEGCNAPLKVINVRRMRQWDLQPLKLGCVRYTPKGHGYLRDVDERVPLKQPPLCEQDGSTRYRRKRWGQGERWVCPKHRNECKAFKVVPGDPLYEL